MATGCGDVLSLEDLQIAKKHQLFEAEVITGLQGGVTGGASIDYATNQVTGQVQKTLPAVLRDAGFRPASFTFATGGTIPVGSADLAVLWPISSGGDGNYYAWKGALPKVIPASSTPAGTGGVSSSGWVPFGDITLRSLLASTLGAGNVNTLSGITVQGVLDKTLQYQDPALLWSQGGTLKIRQGVTTISTPLIMDYANFDPKFQGSPGVRCHYEGDNMAETIFNCTASTFNIQMKGDNSYATQRVHTYDYLGNITLNGNSTSFGLLVQGKAYSKLENITSVNHTTGEGIRLENFITSDVNNIYSQYNNIGIRIIGFNPTGSDLNAVTFNRISASNNTTYGIYGERWGASNVINGLTCEGNGTMGNSSSGGMLINVAGNITAPCVVFNSPYFELNKGGADLNIVNTSATKPITVIINGGLFNRGSNTDYTTTNIAVNSAGGKTKVILIGVAFANSAGYTPSSARPYWTTAANCEVIDIGCIYDDLTAASVNARSLVLSGRVTAAGAIGTSSTAFTCATSATGVYTVTSSAGDLGFDSGSYIVMASPYNANADVTIEVNNLSTTAFRVIIRNSGGTGVACGFNFMISRII